MTDVAMGVRRRVWNTAKKGRGREAKTRARMLAGCRATHPEAVMFLRSAASKGPFDLVGVCFLCGRLQCVQSKSRDWPGRDEAAALARLATFAAPSFAASIEVWRWRDYQRTPDVRVVRP